MDISRQYPIRRLPVASGEPFASHVQFADNSFTAQGGLLAAGCENQRTGRPRRVQRYRADLVRVLNFLNDSWRAEIMLREIFVG
jgi:hypothetical protein